MFSTGTGLVSAFIRTLVACSHQSLSYASLNPAERLVHRPRLLFAAAGCAPGLVGQERIAGSSRRFARRHYGIVNRRRPRLRRSVNSARLVHEIASDAI